MGTRCNASLPAAMTTPVRYIRYDPSARFEEVRGLSPGAELAHRRLADLHLASGSWVAAARSGAAFCRVPPRLWPAVLAELAQVGWRQRAGRLHNSRVHRARAEAVVALRLQQQGGRIGAKRRWDNTRAQGAASAIGGPPLSHARTAPDGVPNGVPNGHPNGDPILPNKTGPETHVAEPGTAPALNVKNVKDVKGTGTPIRLSAERLTRSASASGQNGPGEKEFLEAVRELFGPNGTKRARVELENWGGWWRNRFRDNPGKARRVLAEVKGLVRERRITMSPGAAAVDLWKRLP